VVQSERIKFIGSENDPGETITFRAVDVVDRSSKQESHVRCTWWYATLFF